MISNNRIWRRKLSLLIVQIDTRQAHTQVQGVRRSNKIGRTVALVNYCAFL